MAFHIFGLSGLEQAAFFHNPGQMKEALPLVSLLSYFETTPRAVLIGLLHLYRFLLKKMNRLRLVLEQKAFRRSAQPLEISNVSRELGKYVSAK